MKLLTIVKAKLALKVLAILPILGLSYYFLWDGVASPMAISYLPPGTYSSLSGSYYDYLNSNGVYVPKSQRYGGIVDLKPNRISSRIRDWNVSTMLLGERQIKKDTFGTGLFNIGTGFWHVNDAGQGESFGWSASPRASQTPLVERRNFDLRFGGWLVSSWTQKGPIPLKLYHPLKHLLADCALEPYNYVANRSTRLDIPVVVGKDKHGKDMIVMKPLITKVVTSDGQRIEVFTGNPAEDKYLDKKFNQP